jgi:hypothetical protein
MIIFLLVLHLYVYILLYEQSYTIIFLYLQDVGKPVFDFNTSEFTNVVNMAAFGDKMVVIKATVKDACRN